MARSGFGLTLAVAVAVGIALGTVAAIVVATRRNNEPPPATEAVDSAGVESPAMGSNPTGTAAEAERLNIEGTNAIKDANFDKARRLFKRAHDLTRNPRYAFNEALAYEATESNDEAIFWLKIAAEEHPDARLMEKISHRRGIIEKRMGSAKTQ